MTDETTPVIALKRDNDTTDYLFKYPEDEISYELPWEVLRGSASIVQQARQASRTKPVDSWDFMQEIEKELHEADILYEKTPIIINKNSCSKVLSSAQKIEYKDKHVPIDKWIFDKMIMQYSFVTEGPLRPGIAFSLGKRGFEVRYGLDVFICKNMCIFGSKILSTFTGSGFHEQQTKDGMLYQIITWLKNYEQELSVDKQIVRAMIETPFDMEGQYFTMIGELYDQARDGMHKSSFIPPISYNNLGEIHDKVKRGRDGWNNINTVWGIYNLITSVLKPERLNMDIGNVMSHNAAWSNYIMDKYVNPFVKYEDLSADLSGFSDDDVTLEISAGQEILNN